MKKKFPPNNIRTLRKLFRQTQADFAATIGVSKDAVVSWENGRNPLSEPFARRISRTTGVDERALLKPGPLWVAYSLPRRPYTLLEYEHHRKTYWGDSDQKSASRQLGPCLDALELLFRAAALAGEDGKAMPLPAVLDAFIVWCRQTEAEFKLLRHIDALLEKRKMPVTLTHTYGEWRETAKRDPSLVQEFGFKDNQKKPAEESLTLSAEMQPPWAPGWNMHGGKK
jgi:transcriptional regulator with XRE-family HTH domain